jgi:hypothetical protein
MARKLIGITRSAAESLPNASENPVDQPKSTVKEGVKSSIQRSGPGEAVEVPVMRQGPLFQFTIEATYVGRPTRQVPVELLLPYISLAQLPAEFVALSVQPLRPGGPLLHFTLEFRVSARRRLYFKI